MTWNPRIQLLPVSKFRDNVKTFFELHMPDALAWATAQCGLAEPPPNPLGYYLSLAVRPARPVVNILNGGADPDDDEDGNRLESKTLTLEVERTAGDSDELIATLEPYVLAMTSMVLEMSQENWWTGIDTERRDDLDVSVGEERYSGRTYENEKVFLQVGSIQVTISYLQT